MKYAKIEKIPLLLNQLFLIMIGIRFLKVQTGFIGQGLHLHLVTISPKSVLPHARKQKRKELLFPVILTTERTFGQTKRQKR